MTGDVWTGFMTGSGWPISHNGEPIKFPEVLEDKPRPFDLTIVFKKGDIFGYLGDCKAEIIQLSSDLIKVREL